MKTQKQFSQEAIEAFKAAYKEEFSLLLTDDEVRKIATRLLHYFGIMNGKKTDD